MKTIKNICVVIITIWISATFTLMGYGDIIKSVDIFLDGCALFLIGFIPAILCGIIIEMIDIEERYR